MLRLLGLFILVFSSAGSLAEQQFDYALKPEKIAKDTYVFIGKKEDFSGDNGGNIVNTGFIVTKQGVVVIDTGPSLIYGEQMRAAITAITDKPIIKVLLTHHHPDHILGNQAYQDVPIYALPTTVELIKTQAAGFLDNLYRMVGYWMKNTEAMTDILPLEVEEEHFTDHTLRYIAFAGHTDADLLILDESTGVLFAGDLVFHNRALTTPHAHPETWQVNLNKLAKLDFKVMVPGHGEITYDNSATEQTLDYLTWLETTIQQAVLNGKDMNETLQTPIPERFRSFGVIQREFSRSVTHRFPVYESQVFEN